MGIKPDNMIDIFLQPGEYYFGNEDTRVRTLLGSCVSITMWHPTKLIGGMCHFVLPSRVNGGMEQLDGRYGDEAILLLFREARRHKTHPSEYVVKVFGGGKMFNGSKKYLLCVNRPCKEVIHSCQNVSCRNASQSIALLGKEGITISSHDLGGVSSRNIIFDISNGKVWVRKNEKFAVETVTD